MSLLFSSAAYKSPLLFWLEPGSSSDNTSVSLSETSLMTPGNGLSAPFQLGDINSELHHRAVRVGR